MILSVKKQNVYYFFNWMTIFIFITKQLYSTNNIKRNMFFKYTRLVVANYDILSS